MAIERSGRIDQAEAVGSTKCRSPPRESGARMVLRLRKAQAVGRHRSCGGNDAKIIRVLPATGLRPTRVLLDRLKIGRPIAFRPGAEQGDRSTQQQRRQLGRTLASQARLARSGHGPQEQGQQDQRVRCSVLCALRLRHNAAANNTGMNNQNSAAKIPQATIRR